MIEKTSLLHVKDYNFTSRPSRRAIWSHGSFLNFVPFDKSYIGACRFGTTGARGRERGQDSIRNVKLDRRLNIISPFDVGKRSKTQDRCLGDDPRCFLYNGLPFCLSWNFVKAGRKLSYKIINLIDGKCIPLSIEENPRKDLEWGLGKNWMPLCVENELYFVVTIDPKMSMLKCQVKDSEAVCSWVTDPPNSIPGRNSFISDFHGGTPFIYNQEYECYFGIGHRHHSTHYHTPYLYTISKDLKTHSINGGKTLKVEYPRGRDAYATEHGLAGEDKWIKGIFDPLSIYEKDGRFYCCAWHVPVTTQKALTGWGAVYEILTH